MAKKVTVEIDAAVLERKLEINDLIEDIREIDTNLAELEALYEMKKEQFYNQYEDKKLLLTNKRKNKQDTIKVLFQQVPQQETKTQRKVMLLSGDVVVKKPKSDFVKDADKLLAWAKANGRDALISRKESFSFKWADFKKRLVTVDEGIVDCETGEYLHIEGLEPIIKSEELEIKY